MCLLDTKRFRFTIFPKKVYKIVLEKDGEYYSAIRGTLIKIRQMQYPEKLSAPIKVYVSTHDLHIKLEYVLGYEFGAGFVFGYKTIDRVFIHVDPSQVFKVLEGTIPPFTRYAVEGDQICARRIFWSKVYEDK